MIQSEINARIAAFTNELEALVRSAAVEAVRQALGSGPAPSARAARPASAPRRGPGRPRKGAPAQPVARVAAAAAPAGKLPTKRKKGAKRSPAELAQIDSAIRGFVKSNPGKGVELMAKSLGVPSKDLKGRISILIDAKKLKKTGQKRATKYFSV